jgi:tRNA G18 (ribose-2'-O)-methylase SpoU
MVAHITYLSENSIEAKFGRRLQNAQQLAYELMHETEFQVESYLHYQGSRFVERFDANSYLYLTRAMDYFDLTGAHGSLERALSQTDARFLITSYTTDWLFTTSQSVELVNALVAARRHVSFVELTSPYGHDSFLLEVDPLEDVWLGDLLADGAGDQRPLVVLDQVTDPHNVGAILRSCAAFNVTALVATLRHSPEATAVLFKSASGAYEHVPFVRVTNLARAIDEMKGYGFRILGLDSDAPGDIGAVDHAPPVAIVLGAEGKGLRQLTRDTMEQSVQLRVPLQVETGVGPNWMEAK